MVEPGDPNWHWDGQRWLHWNGAAWVDPRPVSAAVTIVPGTPVSYAGWEGVTIRPLATEGRPGTMPRVAIRKGYLIALAVGLALFAFFVVGGIVIGVVYHHQRERNDRAARELSAIQWPAQFHPEHADGCAAICLKDYEPVEPAAQQAAGALGIKYAKATIQPGYDGAPVATISGSFDGVPVTVTAYPRLEYPPIGDSGPPTPVSYVEVVLRPSTVLSPAEPA
jgi:hypothetical protein